MNAHLITLAEPPMEETRLEETVEAYDHYGDVSAAWDLIKE